MHTDRTVTIKDNKLYGTNSVTSLKQTYLYFNIAKHN